MPHPTQETKSALPADNTTDPTADSKANNYHTLSRKYVWPFASAFAVLLGMLVLFGWAADIGLLKSMLPGLPVMVPNTALCLVFAGLALWLLGSETKAPPRRRIGQGCALLVILVGFLTLAEYLSQRSLGLDLLLIRAPAAFPGNAFPGRPSPQTAVALCLLGSALLALSRASHAAYRIAQALALAVALIALMAFLGYLTNILFFYGISASTGMAVPTALACLALTFGILCAHPDQALMAVITSDSAGGSLARCLLPAVLLLPLLLGWLRYLGERHGFYDAATGVSLMVLTTILLLTSLLLTTAERLHALDAGRLEALEALRQAKDTLEGERAYLMSSAQCLLWWANIYDTGHPLYLDWDIHFPANEAAQRFHPVALGEDGTYREGFYRARLPDDRDRCDQLGTASVRAGQSYQQDFRSRCQDGSVRWLHEDIHVETVVPGKQWRAVGVCTDITERKRAEEALRESENHYRTLGEAVPDFVWACTAGGEMVYVNRRWQEYTGLTPEQSGDIPMNVLHHPADYPRLAARWQMARLREEAYEAEFRFRRHDSVYRWFMARAVPVKNEQGAVVQWIGTTTDIHERKQAEEAACRANELLNKALESALMGVGALDTEGRFTLINRRLAEMLGYSEAELLGRHFSMVLPPESLPHVAEQFYRTIEEGIPLAHAETQIVRKDGAQITVAFGWSPLVEEGQIVGLVGTAEDITERKRLENQLLQAQKLESVGRLAGGIAHDFNNLLSAILGYTELAEEEYEPDASGRGYLANVRQAAERAANLTRQLLTFARRQVIEPKVVNLNTLMLSLETILRRLITENIQLLLLPEPDLHSVKVDHGQFEQILIYVIVNARDAMPDGGKITVETHNVTLDEEYACHHEDVIPGEYVLLAVSDTGTGMEEGIRLHIFEPFFTTKEQGRGTGLGLATVYGIVKQARGHIWLYSESGEGTTFKIYLPRTTELPSTLPVEPPRPMRTGGSETILLVEDEGAVRTLMAWALRGHGYTILEAANGEEALRLVKGREGEITLLITDVVMPHLSGKDLADRLQAINPALEVLFASGYTENTVVHHGVLEPGIAFLSKPFTPSVLARRVREILDSSGPTS